MLEDGLLEVWRQIQGVEPHLYVGEEEGHGCQQLRSQGLRFGQAFTGGGGQRGGLGETLQTVP